MECLIKLKKWSIKDDISLYKGEYVVPNRLTMLKGRFIKFLFRTYTRVYSWFHPIEKKILFVSFGGKQYSDNPRAISEKMHELYPEFELVWAINSDAQNNELIPGYVKLILPKTIDFYKELATSCGYVTNLAIEPNIYKRKGQFFVQTWHGDRAFKKVLYEAHPGGKRPVPVIDNKVTNICLAASTVGVETYRKAFRYNGDVLNIGCPRNDKLVFPDAENIIKLRVHYGIKDSTKILLFAPTFRDNLNTAQNVMVDLDRVLSILEDKGDDWVCLLRSHSASKGLSFIYDDKHIDVSKYPDMSDLLQIADMLITDYSSCAGDFVLRKKPTFMAMFDADEYTNNCRAFPFDIEKTNLLIAHNQAELEQMLIQMSEKDYVENCEQVISYFEMNETGHSSEKTCVMLYDAYRMLKKS